jgi:RND family efflux transporter MFP subunit
MSTHEIETASPPNAAHLGHGAEDEGFDPAPFRPTRRALGWTGMTALALLAALVGVGVIPRLRARHETDERAKELAATPVQLTVMHATRSSAPTELALPGSVEALQEAGVYARANGYVRAWKVDIGAPVKKGDVLAVLEVPDIEDQLLQGQATASETNAQIHQAQTQLKLARITNDRYSSLGPSGVVTKQEVDQYQAGYEAQKANVAAVEAAHGSALANVRRLGDLKGFANLLAPFDGVVTARTAEVGQLVTSGTSAGLPLFKVAEVDTVRVFVNVPQLYASGITVGMDAPTSVREKPGRVFAGRVARTAHELDTATRTLLTEVDIPNPDDALFAGMYAQVSFHMTGATPFLVVPATAVLIDAGGTRAAVVKDGVLHWKQVEVESDFGTQIAISTGVAEGDVVVVAPSDRLAEGVSVTTNELAAAKE